MKYRTETDADATAPANNFAKIMVFFHKQSRKRIFSTYPNEIMPLITASFLRPHRSSTRIIISHRGAAVSPPMSLAPRIAPPPVSSSATVGRPLVRPSFFMQMRCLFPDYSWMITVK